MAGAATLVLVMVLSLVSGAPQAPPEDPPEPYSYEYHAENATSSLYFGKKESGDPQGRVQGLYYVWLADGRLMTVSYTVDGESGFVPKVTYQENANPIGQPPPTGL